MPRPAPDPTADGRIRVLIVDADDRVRESLAGLLSIGGQVIIVGSAGHAGSAIELAVATRPDVVIMDPRLPDVDAGSALIARLRELDPGTCILAMSSSDPLEQRFIDCGADGCVRKTYRPAELLAAIMAAGRPAPA